MDISWLEVLCKFIVGGLVCIARWKVNVRVGGFIFNVKLEGCVYYISKGIYIKYCMINF